jgi:hypothetical protein
MPKPPVPTQLTELSIDEAIKLLEKVKAKGNFKGVLHAVHDAAAPDWVHSIVMYEIEK